MKKEIICPECEKGKLKEVIEETSLLGVKIKSYLEKCDKCRKTFLNEKQARIFARKLDKMLQKKK